MAELAIVYGSRLGQTFKIATRIAGRLRAHGHRVIVVDARSLPPASLLAGQDGVVIGSSVRGERHLPEIRRFVQQHAQLLGRLPSAFFSVSLAERTPQQSARDALGYVPRFLYDSGWQPRLTAVFGGAMLYSRFGWLGKRVMRSVWRDEGISRDISRDHQYTRWPDVDGFAEAFDDMVRHNSTPTIIVTQQEAAQSPAP